MADEQSDWALVDRMVHEPARLLIITMLYPVASMEYLRLRKSLGYTQGNLSSHLAKLEAAGYVAMEKSFKGKYPNTVCILTNKGRRAISDYAERLRSMARFASEVLTNKT